MSEIDKDVKEWLKRNPECPKDVKAWLTRPDNIPPYVTEKNKRDYMANHAYIAQMFGEFSRPHKITKVNSIQEAIDISMADMKKPPVEKVEEEKK